MNVLLVVMDTARADAFEPYGAPAGASPAVADLARRGAALDDVFAPACWTMPSHAGMFAGALPGAIGLTRAPGGNPVGVKPALERVADRLLPEVLRRAGYATAAISANLWVSAAAGFDTGFDRFVGVQSNRQGRLHVPGARSRLGWALEGAGGRVDDGARAARDELGQWIDAWRGERFFWFVNLVECHSPYLPPRPYGDVSTLARIRAADEARRFLTLGGIWKACLGGFDVPEDALERMRRLYAGAVRYMDDWLADVLGLLDARGALDDTLVIVTSDHGENFGENGLLGHAFSLDDRLIRVPFVCAGPGAPAELPSLVQLPAAIAAGAGLEQHPWRGEDLPPLAVAQFDAPGEESDGRRDEAAREWGLDPVGRARMAASLRVATDGRRKLQRRGDVEELFDLATDPLEERPLDPAGHDVGALRAALDHPGATAQVGGGVTAPPPAADAEELARIEEQMRLLGYL